ncbi:hypothetical protein, partial [uncultured Dialister sp.]|uniref:hypothetical protein n=1 Tax=uncultured Dialister sp. TaxID=278064 RepID=UPI0026DBFFD9
VHKNSYKSRLYELISASLERLMSSQPRKALLCPFREKVVAPATKGGSPPQAAYILIAAKGGDTTPLSGEAAVTPTPSGRKPRQS